MKFRIVLMDSQPGHFSVRFLHTGHPILLDELIHIQMPDIIAVTDDFPVASDQHERRNILVHVRSISPIIKYLPRFLDIEKVIHFTCIIRCKYRFNRVIHV